MEFLDEESRPRVLFQSRPSPSSQSQQPEILTLHKPSLILSLSLSSLIFALSLLRPQPEPLQSLLLWLALSLFLGPFAPSSLTAGDIRVGVGPALPPPTPTDDIDSDEIRKKNPNRRSKPRKVEDRGLNFDFKGSSESERDLGKKGGGGGGGGVVVVEEEREWSEGDLEVLKKQLVKHPVGKPRRWEAVAEAFGGRHGVESVIKMAKSMGEKKMNDADSFSRFLKDRKAVDKRVEGGGDDGGVAVENGGVNWSAGEDIALLNALKTFPKEAAMRWEKIAAAVPGKSKAQCVKRVSELKRDFRSSKASAE